MYYVLYVDFYEESLVTIAFVKEGSDRCIELHTTTNDWILVDFCGKLCEFKTVLTFDEVAKLLKEGD